MGHPSFFRWNEESKKCRLLVPALYPYRLDVAALSEPSIKRNPK